MGEDAELAARPSALPELLAPAGGPDALRAAVAAGADAVYVGLGAWNARAANEGFSLAALRRGCALAHAHGARVYVTLNVYLHDDELADAEALAEEARAAGADAFIVADAGLCLRLRERMPDAELHLSTQAGVQDAGGALLAARELGVSRVTCARELSLSELAGLAATGVSIEAFCHGAICVCYSGACQFSALVRLASPPSNPRSRTSACVDPRSRQSAWPGESGAGRHADSAGDRAWRASDGLRAEVPARASRRSANRGDCTQPCRVAHTLVDGDGNILAGGSGAPAGDRLLCPRDHCSIRHIPELVRSGVAALKIEGRMKNPDYVFNVVRCYRVALDAVAAGRPLGGAALDELEAQLARSFNRGFTDAYLRGRSGADLMSCERAINQGLSVGRVIERRYQEAVVAFDRSVSAGDTLEIRSTPGADAAPDVPKRWPMVPSPADAAAGERLAVPCKRKVEVGSAVHVVRSVRVLSESRAAVAAMAAEEERICAEDPSPANPPSADEFCPNLPESCPQTTGLHGEMSVGGGFAGEVPVSGGCVTSDPDEAVRLLGERGGRTVRVPAHALLEDPPVWEPIIGGMTVVLDDAHRAADAPRVRELCSRAAAVVCRNLGQIDIARAAGIPWEVAAPISVWNAETARWLGGLGARRVWLPDELSDAEAGSIAHSLAGAVPLGRHLMDVPTLMVTEHCLLTVEGPCAGESDPTACAACPRRAASQRGERFLLESDGTRLPVRVDAFGRTRIFAAAPSALPPTPCVVP